MKQASLEQPICRNQSIGCNTKACEGLPQGRTTLAVLDSGPAALARHKKGTIPDEIVPFESWSG
jgi:hypothetical protein